MIATCIGGVVTGAAIVLAQDAPLPHKPMEKTIGQAGLEIVPSLSVMNSAGASLADGKLTPLGIAGNSIAFDDRPIRSAGYAPTILQLDECKTRARISASLRHSGSSSWLRWVQAIPMQGSSKWPTRASRPHILNV